ncbi:MAG: HD domain-containing protein [Candidatus Taylorbacteria bacterium]|nr:HD domain-containing protein [Candidatus Taylorbacteria bacterium]
MRLLKDIYRHYNILPLLQDHQIRVAAVGKYICEHLSVPVDPDRVILACLFHDMGNIIKFDLTMFPESYRHEGVPYWSRIKDEFILKYGADENLAHILIAKEIGLDNDVISIIEHFGFSKLDEVNNSKVLEYKIASYSDCRVTPTAVVSIRGRLDEGRIRYAHKIRYNDTVYREKIFSSLTQLEISIFSLASVKPEEITDNVIERDIEILRNFSLPDL